jgi:hypothetical protein
MSTRTAGEKTGNESRERRGLFRTLWLAWRVRDNEELSAEDAASTPFRFFRSKHVADLKLVAELALILLCFHFSLVVIYAISSPIAHFITNPHLHPGSADKLAHVLDVLFTRVVGLLFTYVGPAITIYGAIVAWSYLSASKRLGIIDLFACEISTLCRVGTIFDVGKIYVDMYDQGPAAAIHAKAKHVVPSQSFVSQEDYFPIFDHNSSDLESLEALVVESITEYYTYMKAARDLLRKLTSIDVSHLPKPGDGAPDGAAKDPWHQSVADLIYVLFLGYESARKAITDLTEFQPTHAEHVIVILLTELICYSFLCKFLEHDKVRFARLQLRQSDYESAIPALIEEVNRKYKGNQGKYWAPAKRTVPELKDRYNAAMDSLKHCIGQQQLIDATTRSVSVTMSRDGIPISTAEPGSTISLQIDVQDSGPGPLHYSWTSETVNLAATDADSVTATLLPKSEQPVVNVKVTNDKGGLLHGSIAIPLTTAALHQRALEFGILDDNGSL